MPTFATRFLVIDTETTGIDTERDRICELGAVYFEGRKFLERRRMLIKPGVPIPEQASCVHGITDAMVAGKPTFAEIAGRVVEHFDGLVKEGRRTAGSPGSVGCHSREAGRHRARWNHRR